MNPEPKTTNPYIGLRPFEQEDSLYFFGRREQTTELLEQLSQTRFLAVVGSSGCGKSSLIRAGLIPSLLGGFLVEERDAWQIAIMKPGDAPLRNLAVAFYQAFDKTPNDAGSADLYQAIIADHIQAAISYLSLQLGTRTNLLLLIDQFEEVFSFRGTEDEEQTRQLSRQQRHERAQRHAEADDFVNLILGFKAYTHLPVYTVLTMRTDFLGDCDVFYGLPEAMNQSRYLVPRLTRQQLREAIEGPARLSKTSLTPRLMDRLLNQLGERADRLPVLQHALLRTWDIWQDKGQVGSLDLEHYAAAGTLRHALSQHADEALRQEDLDTTTRIFKCLTDTDPHHRRVRRPARLSELAAVTGQSPQAVRAILERFREDGRNFLVISASADADDLRVDISHESLIRQWNKLTSWVDEERESRNQFLDLVYRGRRKLALLRDPDLQIALHWRARNHPTVAWAKRYSTSEDDFDVTMQYLDQSQQAAENAMKRRRHQRQLLVLTPITVALFLILITVFQNLYGKHFSLSTTQEPSERVELYKGKPTSWGIFTKYIAETDYQRSQIEPSLLFIKKKIDNYNQMNAELINTFKPVEKLKAYWKSGLSTYLWDTDRASRAFPGINCSIEQYPERKQDIVGVMTNFRSLETIKKLKRYFLLNDEFCEKNNIKNAFEDIRGTILDAMASLPVPVVLEIILQELKNSYPSEVRHAMVEALESISHTDFSDGDINNSIKSYLAELLNPKLNDQSTEEEKRVVLMAARTLMRLGDQRGVNKLIALAKDDQSQTSDRQSRIAQEAFEALTGNRDDRVVVFFLGQKVNDEKNPPWMRRRIIAALAQIGDSEVVKKLSSLVEDKSVQIRRHAVQALGRTGTPSAVPLLLNRLNSDNANHDKEEEEDEPSVQRSIVEALGRSGNNSEDNDAAHEARKAREYLLKNMLSAIKDPNAPMLRITAETLGRIGNATTYDALDALRHATNDIDKRIIIDTLGALDDIRAIDYLKNVLQEETSKNNPEIQQRIAVALGRLGDASAVEPLNKLLHAPQDRLLDTNIRRIRLHVVGALGQLGHKDALPPLQKIVKQQGVDRQDIIYLGALEALGRLGSARVLDDLTAWLQQGDSLMRRSNLESMVGASTANWIMSRILSESGEEGNVRQAAVEVLGILDSIKPVNLLLARLSDGSIIVQRGAARALGRLGSGDIRVVDSLIAHLRDADSGVRQNAAEALGLLGNSRAVAPLIALLQDSQGDVRQAAAEALGKLGDTRALQPLLWGVKGGDTSRKDGVEDARRTALLAYAKIGRKSHAQRAADDMRAVFNEDPSDPEPEHQRVKLAAAVALLGLQPSDPPASEILELLQEYADASQSISNRRELSDMLGEFPSEPGKHILLQLLDDTNLSVRETALKSLGQSKAQDVLPTLHTYLRSENFRLQKAAAEALAASASATSIEDLAAVAKGSGPGVNVEISIPTRLACLKALYDIAKNPATSDTERQTVIEKLLQSVQSKEAEAILGMRAYNLLGNLQAHQALGHLQKRLNEEVASHQEWRRKRDTPEEPAQPEHGNRDIARFNSPLTFELAYNIARIDPRQRGLSLLEHDLADIRQGAWQGLGRVGSVDLIEELYRKLQSSTQSWFQRLWGNAKPFFRQAAYQAIDHILLRLEAEGIDPRDLEGLKKLVPGKVEAPCPQTESFEEQGICRRVKWTIAQLAANGAGK